jgi:hypothetical protein
MHMAEQAEQSLAGVSERRHHVRVQDAVGLHIQRLADMPAAGQAAQRPQTISRGTGTVRRHDKYEIEGYGTVRRDFPAVAAYIDELEERIRELMLNGDARPAKPTHKVSLSAGGIYFSDRLLLHPGEMVSLTLTLFPSGRHIGTDARVISGNDAPEVARGDEPSYRAVFVRMSDADREALGQHVRHLLEKRATLQD